MCLALRAWLHARGSMRSALCARLCALGAMHLALFALGSLHLALCTWLYALDLALCTALCTWLHALGSMYFDSAQLTLCKLVRELPAEEPFATLSGKTFFFPSFASFLLQAQVDGSGWEAGQSGVVGATTFPIGGADDHAGRASGGRPGHPECWCHRRWRQRPVFLVRPLPPARTSCRALDESQDSFRDKS